MLNWANQFSIFVFLDSNSYRSREGRYDCLLAAGAMSTIAGDEGDLLSEIDRWHQGNNDWLFGHIAYDYKNILEPRLTSGHPGRQPFSVLCFFQPKIVCYIPAGEQSLTIECHGALPEEIFRQILNASAEKNTEIPVVTFQPRVIQSEYLGKIRRLREHIKDGDCYEINFCTEGYCEEVDVDTLAVFNKLNGLSPAPFAAYYRNGSQSMMCASPERYVQKRGSRIISQPIKGTARRDADPLTDDRIKQELRSSIKERAENVMIVDLVRNDLSRSCEVSSIKVDELFGIYSFPQVHQMISTVSGELRTDLPLTHPLRYSFPMGSMTGAPKYRVMQLIEQYEHSKRELFSGSIGYFTPSGDFDFNVIIRSLFYNAESRYLSYQTGGAITYDSDPQQEWEEMRLKAWALERIFS